MELGADGTSNRQPSRISCGSNGAVTVKDRTITNIWNERPKSYVFGKIHWEQEPHLFSKKLCQPVALIVERIDLGCASNADACFY